MGKSDKDLVAKHHWTQLHIRSTVTQLSDKPALHDPYSMGYTKEMHCSPSKWICSSPFQSRTLSLQTHTQILHSKHVWIILSQRWKNEDIDNKWYFKYDVCNSSKLALFALHKAEAEENTSRVETVHLNFSNHKRYIKILPQYWFCWFWDQ